jgi:MFS family permease
MPPRTVARSSSWQLLRQRDFCLYFVGSLGSNLGTWLQNTVQVLLAYQFTHSAFFVGLVVSAQFAGTLFLSPWAAVLADRIGVRRTLIGAQCFSAFVAVAMGLTYRFGLLNEWSLVAGALCLGLAFAVALPVQTALVPSLVDPADTKAAMAMNQVSYNTGRALAPALAVLVIAGVGPDLIFALNAVSFAAFALALHRLHRWSVHSPAAENQQPPRARIADGIRAARQQRRLILLLAIVAAVTLADDPVQVLAPGLAHELHVPSDWAGYFIAALGWGTVVCSLPPAVRRTASDVRHASRRAAWSLLALAVSVVMFTMGMSAPVSLLFAVTAGGAALFAGAATQALIVGPHRNAATCVAGLWAIAWAGTKPIASLFDGWSASHVGIRTTGLILVSPAILLALCEILLPAWVKAHIKKWSLSKWLEGIEHRAWQSMICVFAPLKELVEIGVAALRSAGRATPSTLSYQVASTQEPDATPEQWGRDGDDLAGEFCYSYTD